MGIFFVQSLTLPNPLSLHSKTHTMEGNIHSEEDAGIVPRSVNAILQQLEGSGAEFTIRVSFLELCKPRTITLCEQKH